MTVLTYSGTLVTVTCWCGMHHAVPLELREFQERQHRDGREQTRIYCPLGHTHIIAGESEAARLQRELEAARKRNKATRELLDHEQRSHVATKGHLTRTKKRVGNGVCPCCNRHFSNLERHMHAKHPDYAPSGSAS